MKRKTIVVLLSAIAVLCAGLELSVYHGWLPSGVPFLAALDPRVSVRSPAGFVYSFLLSIDSEEFEAAYGQLSPSYRRQKDFTSWKTQMGSVTHAQPWTMLLSNVKANPASLSAKDIDADHWRIHATIHVFDLLIGQVTDLDFRVERQPDGSLSIVDDVCLWKDIWTHSKGPLQSVVEHDDAKDSMPSGKRVEVCAQVRAATACYTTSASTEASALREATSGACAKIASGVTETLTCENAPPTKVTWLRR